jgi:hypothetical protein
MLWITQKGDRGLQNRQCVGSACSIGWCPGLEGTTQTLAAVIQCKYFAAISQNVFVHIFCCLLSHHPSKSRLFHYSTQIISLSNSPLTPSTNSLAGMANAPLDPELIKIYEAVEAALFKIHDAQSDNNNPQKTKEDTNRHLTEASDFLARIKKDITEYV